MYILPIFSYIYRMDKIEISNNAACLGQGQTKDISEYSVLVSSCRWEYSTQCKLWAGTSAASLSSYVAEESVAAVTGAYGR